tara:strand:- start:785 stop:1366 length:582 start_codon:yes stop_codon:yes gene_type:complete
MSFFDFTTKKQSTFIIYTMDALSNDSDSNEDNVALEFTSISEIEYSNDIRIPYEPIEGGEFTSDSKIESPFILKMTVAFVPSPDNKKDTQKSLRQKITDVESTLEEYKTNSKLLLLFNTYPICTVYKNIKLTSISYKRTSDNNMLVANLIFQEVRITGIEYTLNSSTVSNSENAPSQDGGVVTPVDANDILVA